MNTIAISILVFGFAHWVGDFVFQSTWMALNKSKCWKALSCHVGAYVAALAVPALAIFSPSAALVFMGGNFAAHWAIDAVTSKITGHFYAKGDTSAFFTTIGFDQFLHLATIVLLVSALQ